jgi:hypothetical protein
VYHKNRFFNGRATPKDEVAVAITTAKRLQAETNNSIVGVPVDK